MSLAWVLARSRKDIAVLTKKPFKKGLTTRAGAYLAIGGGVGTTLDPANKGSAITLSGGNLTATNNAGTDASVKSTTSHSTGKFYFEATVVADNRLLVGVGNTSATLTNFAGSDANSCGFFDGNGSGFGSCGGVGTSIYTTGDVVCIAIDFTNGFIWARINGGNWNNNVLNDPATNTGGGSIAGMGAGPYFAMVSPGNASTTVTVNFGATAYAQTPPSGFGNW